MRTLLLGGVLMIVASACASEPPRRSASATSESTASAPASSSASSPATPSARPSVDPAATARLVRAISDGDLDAATRAIGAGAELEKRGTHGRTPLVAATKARQTSIAKALLEAGADPNTKDDILDSAYLYAGAEGLNEILEATLEHGANVKSTNRFGGTALIPASEHGHVETVRILLKAGVDVNHVNKLDWTALHEAIVLGDGSSRQVQVVRMLLAAGADPKIRDGHGVLPRDLASSRGYSAIVREIDKAN